MTTRAPLARTWLVFALLSAAALPHAHAGINVEIEPNNTLPGVAPSSGPTLAPGSVISGTITPGDVDLIQITTPSITPPSAGIPTLSRRVFEVITTGDATLDLIEPSTGRIIASSDDASGGVSGGGPGSSRCVFDLLQDPAQTTDWTLLVRGFWPNQAFSYQVRYTVEEVAPPTTIEVEPYVPTSLVDSIAAGEARWYSLSLDLGWLRVDVDPLSQFSPDLAFAVLDQAGNCIAFADDVIDGTNDYWQSSNLYLEGDYFVVIAPASMRSALGVPPPAIGSEGLPLWSRRGVGVGDQAGWTFQQQSGQFTRVPGGTFRLAIEHGTPQEPCLADYDQNGGIDGGDLGLFFLDFEAGEEAADVDNNGGIDGGDLGTFFLHFERGC